jgi:hypothetical protein
MFQCSVESLFTDVGTETKYIFICVVRFKRKVRTQTACSLNNFVILYFIIIIIIQLFIIYIPSQQLQGQLQIQQSIGTIIIIIIIIILILNIIIILQFNFNSIQFNLLFTCRVNSYKANYRHRTA